MDRLIAEIETQKESKQQVENPTETQTENQTEKSKVSKFSIKIKQEPNLQTENDANYEPQNAYLNTFKNVTVADIKRQEAEKQEQAFKQEKEILIQQQFEKTSKVDKNQFVEENGQEAEQEVRQNIIEKPNYDLIEENPKIVKLKSRENAKEKKKSKKKVAGVALAIALGASAVVCVTNTIIIDNLSSSFIEIDETYKLNLAKYLKNIYNLDVTKQSMEMIETFPDEVQNAGDFGEKSNWFDRLCNFIVGIFGG